MMKVFLVGVFGFTSTAAQCSFARRLKNRDSSRDRDGSSGGDRDRDGSGSDSSGSDIFADGFPLSSDNIRSYDGSDQHPSGMAGAALIRISWPNYANDVDMMNDAFLPNPRDISNAVCPQQGVQSNTGGLSDMVWAFGQFLDHDIDLTHFDGSFGTADISAAVGDAMFPHIPFNRSEYIPETGKDGISRQHPNSITSFIDASNVYGSSEEEADDLRTFKDGKMKTSHDRKLLPVDNNGMFRAGDIRANENVVLTTMHTLFVREHNRLAERIEDEYRSASDEAIFQLARKIVGAELQSITYKEFLPALLGPEAPGLTNSDYDPMVDPGIATEFSTAGFRMGHTMLSSDIKRELPGPDGSIGLRDAFFEPETIIDDPIIVEQLLEGLTEQAAQEIDHKIIDDVRNLLFANLGGGGLDLAALNIQRGRDHGLPQYNDIRVAYGLDPNAMWHQVTSDSGLQQQLASVYDSPNDIDAWIGCLVEDHIPGGHVGELLAAILRDQFERLRDGDRFFFLHDRDIVRLPRDIIGVDFEDVRLSYIIEKNTDASVQNNVFHVD